MSTERSDWALFYKTEDERPQDFCEIRRVGAEGGVRSGEVNTWSSCDTVSEIELEAF